MIFPRNLRTIFKTISCLVAGIFLFQQIALAGELLTAQNTTPQPTGVSSNNLQSGQSVAESAVGIKNAVENFSVAATAKTNDASNITYTYYRNGRLESQTLATPDSSGNIYYHYINENWNDQGYGRVDKSRRQTAFNGELSHTYTYYGGTDKIRTKKAYSDANWTRLVARYTYYNNATNRIETKTLSVPDSLGNIYYHYIDEAGLSQDCGRYDKTRRRTALNGELSYFYIYYSDNPFRIETKTAYSDANWKRAVVTYSYYNDETNRLQSKIIIKTGLTTLYYNDATGRIQERDVYSDATRTTLISSTTYYNDETHRIQSRYNPATCTLTTYYNDTTGRIQRKDIYSDSSRTTLISSTTYYNDTAHSVQSIFDANTGIITTYYNDSTGRVESRTLSTPDAQGMIYYHYLNEESARVDKAKRDIALNGEISYIYVYFGDTQEIQYKYAYQNPDFTGLLATYEYNTDGLLIKKTLSSGEIYEYDAQGRIIKYTQQNGDYVTTTYWQSGNKEEEQFFNSAEVLQKICEYYDSSDGLLSEETLTTPDSSGMIYYRYINEDWNNQGYGRVDKSKSLVPLNGHLVYSTGGGGPIIFSAVSLTSSSGDTAGSLQYIGELSYTYTYYDDTDGRLKTKNAYSDADCTNLVTIYNYYNDSTNRLMSKIDVSTGIIYTYYNDPSGCMESKTLPYPDSYGNIYYHYLNENWNGRGCGRIDKSLMQDLSNGELSYSYGYYNDTTGRLKTKNTYSDNNWTILVSSRNYSNDPENKVMPDIGYTYYSSGRIESAAFSIPDSYGNIYYHYIDEDWNGQGYGRIDKSVMQSPINGEISYSYTYYDDGTGCLHEIDAYSNNDFTNLVSVYTYYNDSTNRLQSCFNVDSNTTLTFYNSGRIESISGLTPLDYLGNTYYHFIDATYPPYYGYYKIDKSIRQIPAPDPEGYSHPGFLIGTEWVFPGELSYSYNYYNDAQGREQYAVTGYTNNDWTNSVWTLTDIIQYDPIVPPDFLGIAKLSIGGNTYTLTTVPKTTYDPETGEYKNWTPPGVFWGDTVYQQWMSYYDISSYDPAMLEKCSHASDLKEQTIAINGSGENFSSPPDPQQQQVSNLNKYPHNGDPIDLSWFRDFNELITALQEKYGADPDQLQNLTDNVEALKNFLKAKNSTVSINANISGGVTLTGITPDGTRIETSSYSGEPFFTSKSISPLLGVPIGNGSYVQGDIDIKNGTTVEASFTTNTGSIGFNRIIVSSDLIQSRVDNGTYTEFSSVELDSKTYNFTGEGAKGYYFGTSCDTINSFTGLKTSSESIVYLATDVVTGAREPVTDPEIYGKLLYDIYNNGKRSLTMLEGNIIQTQTQQIVQDALQNVSGVTQDYINAIASKQCSDIFDIVLGIKSYNPPIQ